MNSFEEQTLEALRNIDQRLATLEELAFADIKRVARDAAKRVCEEELAELRDEL